MFTLAQLAHLLNGVQHGNADHAISGLSSLTRAGEHDIVYFIHPAVRHELEHTQAGIVLLKAEHVLWCPVNAIVVTDPLAAITQVAELLTPPSSLSHQGIHPTAQIHPSARIGARCTIGAYVSIGAHVSLAEDVVVAEHTVIEAGVRVGARCSLAQAVIIHAHCMLGNDVLIEAGVVLGASPFNYVKQHGCWQQGKALGAVSLADGVHVGANSVIDRGTVGDTYVAQGVRIDNLVHIAHDATIGKNTVIAGCAAIGAHVTVGNDCIIGGASCLAAFVQLADDVVVSGMSTVSKSLHQSGIYSSGTLAHEHQRWRRNAARFRRLDDYIVRLNALERKINGDVL